ncbi:tyrosine-type recombinase/integrase [Sphingomonas sp. CCH10-B3]|jgi:site-specific recombinase XerD|uniref:tyrosine-type recombinase/integrase n=1 Tax=Sphingomonas sp. CCH10-B3 TaxID=1768757 RepID=UPI000831C5D3|nr:tyrosine-type recombinase/integrase [Sphingomonas sp. CCH10-B3]
MASLDTPAAVTIISPGKAALPQRQAGRAIDRIGQLTELLSALTAPRHGIDTLSYRKALEARSANTVKALANDLACFASFCRSQAGPGLPASASMVVAYCEHLEALGIKPATAARRLTSLSVIHGFLGVASPVREPVVRDTMAGYRRRQGTRQRQAGALRFGLGIEAALALRGEDEAAGKGGHTGRAAFTLTALLAACDTDPPGLRDAALLSLGYDTGLRVAELVRVTVEHIKQAEDGSGAGTLFIPTSKTDQTGQGAHAWISAESMRRIATWLKVADIRSGAVFRRVGVQRRKARGALKPVAIGTLSPNAQLTEERLYGRKAEAAQIAYVVGEQAITAAAVRLILKRTAFRAADLGLVELYGNALEAAIAQLSTHSLRVGLTQDLFASGADAGPVAQALRWTSTATALRYGRELAPASNATAQMLRDIRR